MLGTDEAHCNVCIKALIAANIGLMQLRVNEALRVILYGKSDTRCFDAVTEIEIKDTLAKFDREAILVTEELGVGIISRWSIFSSPSSQPTLFICDPTDRSAFLLRYLESLSKDYGQARISEVVAKDEFLKKWEEEGGIPASITGATAGITCIKRGEIIFAVLINYITQELIVASPSGIGLIHLKIRGKSNLNVTLKEIIAEGKSIDFLPVSLNTPWDIQKKFTTFLGKQGYLENFLDSQIFIKEEEQEQEQTFLHHKNPGGPARILYLSSLQSKEKPIGFILANGEKIIEWVHWLPFIRFASHQGDRSLRLFEVSHLRPWTKDGVLMATSPIYSIFQEFDGKICLDVGFLGRFPNPSKFRATLVAAPVGNEWVNVVMQEFQHREIVFS